MFGVIASLVGGGLAAKGSRDAANAQAAASKRQIEYDRETRDLIFDRFDPAYKLGMGGALPGYGFEMGLNDRPQGYRGFEATPGYEFRRDQGMEALQGAAFARGGGMSGRTMQDAMTFNQGLASDEYGTYMNRLAGLADMGMQAAGGQANAATNSNAATQNALSNLGNARAAGAVGQANAWNGALGNIGGILQYQKNMGGAAGGTNPLANLFFPGGLFGGIL